MVDNETALSNIRQQIEQKRADVQTTQARLNQIQDQLNQKYDKSQEKQRRAVANELRKRSGQLSTLENRLALESSKSPEDIVKEQEQQVRRVEERQKKGTPLQQKKQRDFLKQFDANRKVEKDFYARQKKKAYAKLSEYNTSVAREQEEERNKQPNYTPSGKTQSTAKFLAQVNPQLSSEFTAQERTQIRNSKYPAVEMEVIRRLKKGQEQKLKREIEGVLGGRLNKPISKLSESELRAIDLAFSKESKRKNSAAYRLEQNKKQLGNQLTELKASKVDVKKFINPVSQTKFTARTGYYVGKTILDGVIYLPKTAYKYGVSLEKRSQAGIKNPLIKDIVKSVEGTRNLAKFVKDNPKESALLIGVGVSSGAVSSIRAARNDPAKALGITIGTLFPGTAIKGAVKSTSLLTGRIRKIPYTPTGVTATNIKGVSMITDKAKGLTFVKASTSGQYGNINKNFKIDYKLTVNPVTKKVTGKARVKVTGEKTYVTNIKLDEKTGYFIDTKTGEKLPKVRVPITKRNIQIKETIVDKNRKVNRNELYLGNIYSFKELVTRIQNKRSDTISRTGEKATIRQLGTNKLLSEQVRNILYSKQGKKVRFTKFTNNETQRIEKFLKSIDYDERIINGLDRRTRLANALGLKKNNKWLKAVSLVTDDDGKVKTVFRSATAKFSGKFESESVPITMYSGIGIPKNALTIGKKGNVVIGRKIKFATKVPQGATPKVFSLPMIDPSIRILKKQELLALGLGNDLAKISRLSSILKQRKGLIKSSKAMKFQKLYTKAVVKVNERVKAYKMKTKQIQTPKYKLLQKVKAAQKQKLKNITKSPVARTPRLPKVPRIPRVPKFPRIPRLPTVGKGKGGNVRQLYRVKLGKRRYLTETSFDRAKTKAENYLQRTKGKQQATITSNKRLPTLSSRLANVKYKKTLNKVTLTELGKARQRVKVRKAKFKRTSSSRRRVTRKSYSRPRLRRASNGRFMKATRRKRI